MKISKKQFQKAVELTKKDKKNKEKRKRKFSEKEIELLVEILKNLPENAIRHLNYEKVKEELKKVSPEDIAEKILIREIVDNLLKKE